MKKIVVAIFYLIGINLFSPTLAIGNFQLTIPDIQSEAVIVVEGNSGKVFYQKNSSQSMYPASLTKIATAIYAIEKSNLEDQTIVSLNATQVDGTRVYLEEGEEITLKKLVQGLLINSGNDAGIAIAEHMGGNVEKFAEKLNEYLINEVGLQNTNFKNPHGLFDKDHITTAEDLAILTQYAMQNKVFQNIFSTKELEWKGQAWETTLYTHHKLMREDPYKGITGGKTGYVDQSGQTLVTTAQRDNLNIIVVTLNASSKRDIYNDTKQLLDYAFEHFETRVIPEGKVIIKNKNEFKVPQDIYYTTEKGEETVQNISEDGKFEILSSNQELLKTIQLDKVEREQQNKGLSSTIEKKEQNNYFLSNLTAIPVILTLAVLTLYYRRIKRYG